MAGAWGWRLRRCARRRAGGACVWLQNLASAPQRATGRLAQTGIQSADRCDRLGQPSAPLPVADGGVSMDVPARGVVGVFVECQE